MFSSYFRSYLEYKELGNGERGINCPSQTTSRIDFPTALLLTRSSQAWQWLANPSYSQPGQASEEIGSNYPLGEIQSMCICSFFSFLSPLLCVVTLRQTSPIPVVTQAAALYLSQCQERKRSMHNANYKAEVVIPQQPGCSTWTRSGCQGAYPSSQAYLSGCWQMPSPHRGAQMAQSQSLFSCVCSNLILRGLHPSWQLFWSSWGLCLLSSIRQNQRCLFTQSR